MAEAQGTDPVEEWSFDRLRDAAFDRARHRGDVGFFVGLLGHTPALAAAADEGGSLGEISGSLIEVVEAAREAFRGDPGELEPMLRAVFTDYLQRHPAS